MTSKINNEELGGLMDQDPKCSPQGQLLAMHGLKLAHGLLMNT